MSDWAADAGATRAGLTRGPLLAVLVGVVLAIGYALYVVPGESMSAVYTHDTLVFFDGNHRLGAGQWPSVDFSTPLGFLGYVLPWLGQWTTGDFGGAMEAAGLIAAIFLLPLAALILAPRCSPLVSAVVLFTLGAVTIVPINLGEFGTRVSAGMFYNRWGWAALTIVFLTAITPVRPVRPVAEGVVLGLLVAFLVYLKVSYAAVAVAYLGLFALVWPHLRAPAVVAAAVVLLALALGWVSGYLTAYVADIRAALAASGAVREGVLQSLYRIAPELAPVPVALGIAWWMRSVGWRAAGFAIFVMASGIALINQNAQSVFIVSLLAIWALLFEAAWRHGMAALRLGVGLAAAFFLLPQMVNWAAATYEFRQGIRYAVNFTGLPGLGQFYAGESWMIRFPEAGTPPDEVFNDARLWRPMQVLGQTEYVETLRQGIALLEENGVEGTLLPLDYLDPFSPMLDLPRVAGGYSWLHVHRNISAETAPAAKELLGGIEWVIVPVHPVWPPSAEFLWETYGAAVEDGFTRVGANDFWVLWRRG